jgi:signal transduction histidine kinase
VGGFADLVAESMAVGTLIELIEDGDPALASPVVGRIAYCVLREALTNVRKHAPGAQVTVRVEYDEAQVRITVRNSAPTGRVSSALAGTGSGMGIARLRRRNLMARRLTSESTISWRDPAPHTKQRIPG